MDKKLIVKDNALINASYNLSLVEQRLLLLTIVQCRKMPISSSDELTVYASDYVDVFHVSDRTAGYHALKDACNSLFERRFSYEQLTKRGKLEVVKSRWVSQVSYIESEAKVRLVFTPAVISLIRNLEKQFTSYELAQVSRLKSAYAIRLYELLISWKNGGCKMPCISLEDLRSKLGVDENSHKRIDHFKGKVLDYSVKQINTNTNITATYSQKKRGRAVTGFNFEFKVKPEEKEVIKIEDKAKVKPLSDGQRTYFSSLLADHSDMSRYAKVGWDFKKFKDWIREELTKPEKIDEWKTQLAKVGYVPG